MKEFQVFAGESLQELGDKEAERNKRTVSRITHFGIPRGPELLFRTYYKIGEFL